MKIGIVCSGFDMLWLFKVLAKLNHEYYIYRDWNNWPYGDKDYKFCLEQVKKWVNFLEKQVDYILVPAVFEHILVDKNPKVINLFQIYLQEYCLKYSLIWKIWFVWDYSELENIKEIFDQYKEDYKLTDNQSKINKFHKTFPVWKKQTTMWKYYLLNFGNREPMVRKNIKFDLKYFSDAWIDTLIPLNWSYLSLENIIKSKLGKIRFHDSKIVEEILIEKLWTPWEYWINIFSNWTTDLILSQKKWNWLLSRWKNITINETKI